MDDYCDTIVHAKWYFTWVEGDSDIMTTYRGIYSKQSNLEKVKDREEGCS